MVRPLSLRLRKAQDTFFIFAIIVPTVHRTASASKYLDFHRVSEGGFLGQQRSWARGAEARSVTPGRSNGLVFLPGVLSVWETLRSATAVWMWTADMRGRPVQAERLGWQVLRKSLAPMSLETFHFQHALVSVPYSLLCPHFFLLHIAALFVVHLGQLFLYFLQNKGSFKGNYKGNLFNTQRNWMNHHWGQPNFSKLVLTLYLYWRVLVETEEPFIEN